jgi:hypothetical protein
VSYWAVRYKTKLELEIKKLVSRLSLPDEENTFKILFYFSRSEMVLFI